MLEFSFSRLSHPHPFLPAPPRPPSRTEVVVVAKVDRTLEIFQSILGRLRVLEQMKNGKRSRGTQPPNFCLR